MRAGAAVQHHDRRTVADPPFEDLDPAHGAGHGLWRGHGWRLQQDRQRLGHPPHRLFLVGGERVGLVAVHVDLPQDDLAPRRISTTSSERVKVLQAM